VGDAGDTIVVTGLRGAKLRSLTDSPAPIDVIQGEQISSAGRAELGETLSKLLPSINFVTNQAGVTSIVRPVVNRGLGPAYTLVLVNGKRRHNGAQITAGSGDNSGVNPVDFDLIPLSSVEQVEVLKDSAAAQYGSDAVAGVVNVQLKRGTGGHAAFTYGSLYGGQGSLDSWKAQADFGVKLGDDGFVHFSADARHRGMAWWNFPATNINIYGSPTAPSTAAAARNATWNRDGAHNGDPKIDAQNISYNAELPLSEAITAYSFATFGWRKTAAGNNFRRPNGLASFDALFPDGYYAINNTRERDYQAVVGAKGDLAGWEWDLSTSYGRNRSKHSSELTINPSLGPTSPTSFDNLATYQFSQWVSNLDITQGLEIGLAKSLQVSLGAEFRRDKFQTFAGDPLGYTNGGYLYRVGDQFENPNVGRYALVGAQSSFTIRPSEEADIGRSVFAGYLDLGIYPVDEWYVGAAARVEHYSDASGTTVGGKLNSRYDITPRFALRGTIGTGFRAPSLSQIAYAQTDNRTALINGLVVPALSVLARNASPLARALGAQDLKPEKSLNFGLGFVWQPTSGVNVTVDAYQVRIRDRIIRTGNLSGSSVLAALLANGYSGTEFVSYFANAVDTRSRGVDVVIDGRRDLGSLGKLGLTASLNVNKTKILRIADSPAALGQLDAGFVFFGRDRQGELSVANPETKLILAANWSLGPVSANLQTARYGGVTYWRSQLASQDVNYRAKWITDIEVAVDLTRFLKLSVGAANVFDVRPDANGPVDANTGTAAQVYGPSPFAPSGGYYYGRVAVTF